MNMNMNENKPKYVEQALDPGLNPKDGTEISKTPEIGYSKYFTFNKNSTNKYLRDFHIFETRIIDNLPENDIKEDEEKIIDYLYQESSKMSDKDFLELIRYLENEISTSYISDQVKWPKFLSRIISKLSTNKDINCLKKISAEIANKKNDIETKDDGTSYDSKYIAFKNHADNLNTKSLVGEGNKDTYIRWNNQYVWINESGKISISKDFDIKSIDEDINTYGYITSSVNDYFTNDKEIINSFFNIKKNQLDIPDTLGLLLSKSTNLGFIKRIGVDPLEMKPEQVVQFLIWLSSRNQKELPRIEEFTKKYGINGIQAFLSVGQGGDEMGNKILSLGEKLPKESAEKLFAKYGEIIDIVNQTEGNIQEVLKGDKKVTPENIQSIKNSLLKKGKDILVNFSNIANKMKEKDSKIENEEVISKLNEIQKENLIFCSIFESLKKSEEPVYFENIKDLEIKRLDARQIPIEDINEMKKIISENYNDKKELQNTLLKSFQNIFDNSNSNTDLYILKYKDKIVSFCRFDFMHDKHEIYFGSFNVNKNYGNGMIGTAMLDEVVHNMAVDAQGDYLIKADCSAYSPIGAKYIENGFWSSKFYDFAGEPSLAIERDDEFSRDSYTSKKMSKEEIVRISNNEIEKEKFRDMYFTKAKDKEDFQFDKINDENMVLTRYFKDGDSTYLVFEKAKNRKDKSNQEHAYIY